MKESTTKSRCLKAGFILIWIPFILLNSCGNQNEHDTIDKGSVKFSFANGLNSSKQHNSANKVVVDQNQASPTLILSIDRANGENVYTLKHFELLLFGDAYITVPIALQAGAYQLTDYMVMDKDGNIIYGTPKEGSPYENAVDDALPIAFEVEPNVVSTVSPQVVATQEYVARDFGYEAFSFDIVDSSGTPVEDDVFEFLISIFAYDENGHPDAIEDSILTISSAGGVLYTGMLGSHTNQVVVPNDVNEYEVRVSKDGYSAYVKMFTKAEIAGYSEPDGLPLVVVLKELSEGLPEGLIFWNKLGSADEVSNSEIGSDIAIEGEIGFTDGVFGNGFFSKGHWYLDNRIIIPENGLQLDPQKGTVEAWVNYPQDPIVWAYNYGMFSILDGTYQSGSGRDNTLGQQVVNFIGDGVTGVLNSYYVVLNFGIRVELQIPNIHNIFQPGTFHHVSIVWDKNGIETSNDTIRLYIDNVVEGTSEDNNWGDIPDIGKRHTIAKGAGFNDFSPNGNPAFIIDNLKVWDYAKTDFSDRFEE